MEPKLTTLLLNISLGFFFFRFRFICLFVFFFPSKISGILFICICFCVPNAQLIDSYFEMVYWFTGLHIVQFISRDLNKKIKKKSLLYQGVNYGSLNALIQ